MKTIDSKSMGERIRHRREELNISREQLAELLDVSPKFIADIECGIRGVSLKRLVLLSTNLLISTDYILLEIVHPAIIFFSNLLIHAQILKSYN